MIKQFCIVVVLMLGVSYGAPSFSHKLNAAETSVSFNQRTQSIEFVHRFYLHDVDHLTQRMFKKTPDADKSKRLQMFVDYITETYRLSLTGHTETQAIENTIGHEVDGKFLYIYQEHKGAELNDVVRVNFSIEAMLNRWAPSYLLINLDAKSFNSSSKKEASSLTLDRENTEGSLSLVNALFDF